MQGLPQQFGEDQIPQDAISKECTLLYLDCLEKQGQSVYVFQPQGSSEICYLWSAKKRSFTLGWWRLKNVSTSRGKNQLVINYCPSSTFERCAPLFPDLELDCLQKYQSRKQKKLQNEQNQCSICLDQIQENDNHVMKLPCQHRFHGECFYKLNTRKCPVDKLQFQVDFISDSEDFIEFQALYKKIIAERIAKEVEQKGEVILKADNVLAFIAKVFE